MSFSNVLPIFANQLQSLLQRKPGFIVSNFGPAAVAKTALANLSEVVQDNNKLTDTIEVIQLEAKEAANGREQLIKQNIVLQNELVQKETFVQRLIQQHKAEIDEQRVQHESELVKLRSRLSAEHHTRLHLALVEAAVEHATEYQAALKSVQEQKRSLRTLEKISNTHRQRAEQLVTSFADCKAKLTEMETTNRHLQEAVRKQTDASNIQFQELVESRKTIDKMRAFYSILLQKRDEQIFGLQERIEALQEVSDNISEVAPNYYKILGVERNADLSELQAAYRVQCRKHHPDKHRDSPDQATHEAIFKTMKYGYDVLRIPYCRTKYNKWFDMEEVRLAHQSKYCSP